MKKIILHLCADIGSDSRFYQLDDDYEVIMIGEEIGVENYHPPKNVYGVIANPPCTEFSTADYSRDSDTEKGMFLVNHCLRIIEEANPKWWMLENPATGTLKKFIGKPRVTYQPWEYGSSWTKKTALWGNFTMPEKTVLNRKDVKINPDLYIRARDTMPSLVMLHKSAINFLPEYEWCKDRIKKDADIRSLCSAGFAKEFYKSNI